MLKKFIPNKIYQITFTIRNTPPSKQRNPRIFYIWHQISFVPSPTFKIPDSKFRFLITTNQSKKKKRKIDHSYRVSSNPLSIRNALRGDFIEVCRYLALNRVQGLVRRPGLYTCLIYLRFFKPYEIERLSLRRGRGENYSRKNCF